jgi:hypothetical protein
MKGMREGDEPQMDTDLHRWGWEGAYRLPSPILIALSRSRIPAEPPPSFALRLLRREMRGTFTDDDLGGRFFGGERELEGLTILGGGAILGSLAIRS